MQTKKDSKSYNLLIIEDNPGDFMLIEDYLLEYIISPKLTHATSLQEAKKIMVSESMHKFDLVMLDLTLPDGDGASLITSIVETCSECPVVVLTGYTDFDFSVKSLALGASDYLLKDELTPFSLYKSIVYNIERKRTHMELEESQRRYSNLFHLSPDPTWVCDKISNKFLDVNEAAVREYGFSKDEFMLMTLDQLEPEQVDDSSLNWNNFIDSDKYPHKRIYLYQKKDGDIFIVENQTSEILYKGTPAYIMVAHDITERIKHIEAIERQNQRFSEIAWIQSHVVRAPIARLMGLIDLMEHPASDEKLKSEMLAYILESAHELDGIVREITRKAEEIDLNNYQK